jgi:hypothetical protein
LGITKEYSMKNIFKLFGLIALVAVIGLSFSTCEDQLGDDEASITIQSGYSYSSLKIDNNSKYEITVTVKDKMSSKGKTKTIAAKKYDYFYSVTSPITIIYSPASKIRTIQLSNGVMFSNK